MAKSVTPIKRWTTKHELVVQLHIGTMGNLDIAELTKYTPLRVSQIINDPQGQRIVNAVLQRMREKMMGEIEDGILTLTEHAVQRLAETLKYEDFVVGSDAKKHQDTIALGFLKGTKYLGNGGNVNGHGEGRLDAPLDSKLSSRLILALEESNKAEVIRQEVKESAVDADFEIVETEGDSK